MHCFQKICDIILLYRKLKIVNNFRQMTKNNAKKVLVKTTKDQILEAYHEVLTKLTEKQIATPQEQKKPE